MSKTILMTGASSGFGRDTAETLAKAGHRVFASMRDVGRPQPRRRRRPARRGRRRGRTRRDRRQVGRRRGPRDPRASGPHRRPGEQRRDRRGGRDRGLLHRSGQAAVRHQCRRRPADRPGGASRDARRRRRPDHQHRLGAGPGHLSVLRPLRRVQVRGRGADRQPALRSLSQLGVDVTLVQPSAYPTNMYASILHPADAATGASYGEIGAIPGKMFETFTAMFSADGAPNPHDVAAAVAALVATPKGDRRRALSSASRSARTR